MFVFYFFSGFTTQLGIKIWFLPTNTTLLQTYFSVLYRFHFLAWLNLTYFYKTQSSHFNSWSSHNPSFTVFVLFLYGWVTRCPLNVSANVVLRILAAIHTNRQATFLQRLLHSIGKGMKLVCIFRCRFSSVPFLVYTPVRLATFF